MSQNPKLFIHGKVYMLTFSIQRGLPLVANSLIKELILSSLARASELYQQTIGDFLVMRNHIHMFIKVNDPDLVDDFVCRIKTETSHAINRLRGIPRGSVWVRSYDSPVILDLDKLIEKICYVYTNPQEANLADTIEKYPHLSSWKIMLNSGRARKKCYRISRDNIPAISTRDELKSNWDIIILRKILNRRKSINYLEINPRALFEALKHTYNHEISYEEYKKMIISKVRELEHEYRKKRKIEGKPVMKPCDYKTQSIFEDYIPRPTGRKTVCLTSDKKVRIAFIEFFRELSALAREAYRRFKEKGILIDFPPGFFLPGGSTIAAMLPSYCSF